jgi:uncharacterized membrane protein YgcG/HAMP domain-containing protein
MRALIPLAAVLLAAVPVSAVEGPITAPTLQAGQYVYVIPEGFTPEGIGTRGLRQIQDVAAGLHHPFYVVIVESIPTLTSDQVAETYREGYTQRGEELQATYGVDKLAEAFARQNADFDASKSSVFLLSYHPREFRMLAGAEWRTKLGLEKGALGPFTGEFRRAVTGTPKDPKGGIIALMKKFDDEVWSRTDPDQIERRAAEAEQREATARADQAWSALRGQIARLRGLLRSDPSLLPADTRIYQTQLDMASSNETTNPETTNRLTEETRHAADALEESVEAKRAALSAERTEQMLGVLFFAIIASLAALLTQRRLRLLGDLRNRWATMKTVRETEVRYAATRYVDGLSRREGILSLKDATGATREVWTRATAEADDIWIGVQALKERLEKVDEQAVRGSFFNVAPLQKAVDTLDSEFEFATGAVRPEELFSPSDLTIRIDGTKFRQQLAERFQANKTDWDILQRAADARLSDARTMFPRSVFDDLLVRAAAGNVPIAWLDDHPLAGDKAACDAQWDSLDALRSPDPVAFVQRIDGYLKLESSIRQRLERLVAARQSIESCRIEARLPVLETVLAPEDDPQVTLSAAWAADRDLDALFSSAAPSKNVAAIETAREHAAALYARATEQQAAAEAAMKSAWQKITNAATALQEAGRKVSKANWIVTAALRVHSKAKESLVRLHTARNSVEQAEADLGEARHLWSLRRHLEADRKASAAAVLGWEAVEAFNQCIADCAALDAQKAQLEAKLLGAERRRRSAVDAVQTFGGRATVPEYRPIIIGDGPVDYFELNLALSQQESSWTAAVESARLAHEAAQAALASHSSWSDSSGGSWDSGGSSSGGGSWDSGGGSFDGGGSSSDGGHW